MSLSYKLIVVDIVDKFPVKMSVDINNKIASLNSNAEGTLCLL